MKELNLNEEETELLNSLESGEWNSLNHKDLEAIKTFAVEEGLPYQTLLLQ